MTDCRTPQTEGWNRYALADPAHLRPLRTARPEIRRFKPGKLGTPGFHIHTKGRQFSGLNLAKSGKPYETTFPFKPWQNLEKPVWDAKPGKNLEKPVLLENMETPGKQQDKSMLKPRRKHVKTIRNHALGADRLHGSPRETLGKTRLKPGLNLEKPYVAGTKTRKHQV